jgi:hypothetical protein
MVRLADLYGAALLDAIPVGRVAKARINSSDS